MTRGVFVRVAGPIGDAAASTADHGSKILKKSRAGDEDVFVEMARVVRDWAAKSG